MAKSFFELQTWQEAHTLTMRIYQITTSFPVSERFGLSSQLRRAAVSVGSNLAEGSGRGSKKDIIRFVVMARGSVQEVIYQLYLACQLGYLGDASVYQEMLKRYNGLSFGLTKQIEGLSR
ncbi:MAG: four helix bundle protein [Patescibacteria group bacterium]